MSNYRSSVALWCRAQVVSVCPIKGSRLQFGVVHRLEAYVQLKVVGCIWCRAQVGSVCPTKARWLYFGVVHRLEAYVQLQVVGCSQVSCTGWKRMSNYSSSVAVRCRAQVASVCPINARRLPFGVVHRLEAYVQLMLGGCTTLRWSCQKRKMTEKPTLCYPCIRSGHMCTLIDKGCVMYLSTITTG